MNITPEDRLGDLITRFPALTVPLEDWGMDFCCGGNKSLGTAAAEKNLEVGTMITMLNKAASRSLEGRHLTETLPRDNPAEYDTPKLISHIKYAHHSYLRRILPELVALSGKVAAAHSLSAPWVWDLEAEIHTLASELHAHLETEEKQLFPEMEKWTGREDSAGLEALIQQLEGEHQGAGGALERIRTLTQDFALPSWACKTYRKLMGELKSFEADMHKHVHLENSVLFPRFSASEV